MADETWHVVLREIVDDHLLFDEQGAIVEIRESLPSKNEAILRFMELISDIRGQNPDCTIRAVVEEREEVDEDGNAAMIPGQVFTTNNDIQDYLDTIHLIDQITVHVVRQNEDASVRVYEMFFSLDM